MINVTKLNGSELVINADLIEFVECTPDTLISLTTGRKIMVQESLEDIIQLALKFRRNTRSHPVPAGSDGSVFEGDIQRN
ncbi:MAG: flagellar FlbD family protein [bacterium]|nr:flagellar FlbD family protein [bacterium]MCP4799176.1 flagellar FlbD family protein [bacterium]